jgi:hypothetical protein
LVKALEQTDRFTVVNNSGPREVLQRGVLTAAGDISERVKERLGSLGDAELIVAGALTAYQLSKESKNAGLEADLLFRETQAEAIALDGIVETAKRTFNNIKAAGLDRVTVELWLFDAKTGKRLAATRVEGTQGDATELMVTPMQQAVHGVVSKSLAWLGETEKAFRAGTLAPLPTLEAKIPPGVDRGLPRAGGTSPTKSPVSRSRTRAKSQSRAVEGEAEKLTPATSVPEIEREDFSETAPSKSAEGGKPLPQEEWGEK